MDLNVVDQIRKTFNTLPDCRKRGNNQKYAVEDAALSAFSVFFKALLFWTLSCGCKSITTATMRNRFSESIKSLRPVKLAISLTLSYQKRCIRCWRRPVTSCIHRAVWSPLKVLETRCWSRWTAQIRSVQKRFPVRVAPGKR